MCVYVGGGGGGAGGEGVGGRGGNGKMSVKLDKTTVVPLVNFSDIKHLHDISRL